MPSLSQDLITAFIGRVALLVSTVGKTFTAMRPLQHLCYWVFPLAGGIMLTSMYYAGPRWMQEIVAPAVNREYGLLENVEHLVLLFICLFLIKYLFTAKTLILKFCFFAAALWFSFILLEEIDYGLHWIELFSGTPDSEKLVSRNVHNSSGQATDLLRAMGNISMAILFFIVPYFVSKKYLFKIARLIPSRRMLFPLLCVVLVGAYSEYLESLNLPTNQSLAGNRAEFDETVSYFAYFVYVLEISPQSQVV